MKTLFTILAVLHSLNAFATTGIDCGGIDSNLKISTEEAIADGNNLISLKITAPFISDRPIQMRRIDGDLLVVDREVGPSAQEVIYMAHQENYSLTLKLNSLEYEDTQLSEAILSDGKNIFKEHVFCSENL